MSKVICDVCGTAYPETSATCPICGSAKKSGDQTAAGNISGAEGASYTYVKGGRFSKKNVRRRNQNGGMAQETRVPIAERKSKNTKSAPASGDKGGDEGVNKGLIAVVIVLLLAIVAVLLYIGLKFFAAKPDIQNNPQTTPTTNTDPTGEPDPTEPPTDANVPCTDLTLSKDAISFTSVGSEYPLVATPAPSNCTEAVTFVSADETIATVSADGVVKAVGFGETTITITCGNIVRECTVSCVSDFTFEFNANPKWNDPVTGLPDVTVTQGQTWKAYKGTPSVPVELINWISEDSAIAIVENGIVTAVSPGKTYIYAEYGGKTYKCIFHCKAAPTVDSEEHPSTPSDTAFSFRDVLPAVDGSGKYDTTLRIGETWMAYANGIDPANVAWVIDDESICTIENGIVTPLAVGNTELHASYDGVTFTCIVRVTNPAENP